MNESKMEEDDQDEILQGTDDESLSEYEDQCLPMDNKTEEDGHNNHTYLNFDHSKLEFILTKITLVLSTTALLILLPLYEASVNVGGNVYVLIVMTTLGSTVIMSVCLILVRHVIAKCHAIEILKLPMKFCQLLQLAAIYTMSGFSVIYALDRKRVLCHLQDPIKGIVLVWSLLYYFFFCRKLMGLQQIFSATTIIVGLFISVDYGLCDEFRCRGFEKQHAEDDAGTWSWQVHSVFTCIYIGGLALFAAYFTLLERFLIISNHTDNENVNLSVSLLSTVSSSVSSSSFGSLLTRHHQENTGNRRNRSALHLTFWLHIFGSVLALLMFWTSLIPQVGKSGTVHDFFNVTFRGVACHFRLTGSQCGGLVVISWLFIAVYSLFAVTFVKFLMLSQSAVYTVATMASSLPLIGIWWSLIHFDPNRIGLMSWAPSVTGELVCSLLGLPIIAIGLCLLCKTHLRDCQWSKSLMSRRNRFA